MTTISRRSRAYRQPLSEAPFSHPHERQCDLEYDSKRVVSDFPSSTHPFIAMDRVQKAAFW